MGLQIVEVRPGVTLQLNDADYQRWLRQKTQEEERAEPFTPCLIRVEVEPGIMLQLTPEEAERWREHRDRRRAAAAAAVVARPAETGISLEGCGVRLVSESETASARLSEMGLEVVSASSELLPFDRTLIWDPEAPLRLDLIPNGFHLITRFAWQIAVPLWSYEQLARDMGSEEARAATEAIIRDLRVPVYDPRVLFFRRCPETEALLETWQEEAGCGSDDDGMRLAFMRALYRVKPLVCALPVTWVGR